MKINKELLVVALVLFFIGFGLIYAESLALNRDLNKLDEVYTREIELSNTLQTRLIK